MVSILARIPSRASASSGPPGSSIDIQDNRTIESLWGSEFDGATASALMQGGGR
jgi:hypothetical protein